MRKPANRIKLHDVCTHRCRESFDEQSIRKRAARTERRTRTLFHGHDTQHTLSFCLGKSAQILGVLGDTSRSLGANSIAERAQQHRKRRRLAALRSFNKLAHSLTMRCLFIGIKLFLPPPPLDHEQINL